MNTRSTVRYVLAATAALLVSTTSVLAAPVGGSVTVINNASTTFANAITIGSATPGVSNAQTDTIIVNGQIDNNDTAGWKLTITSANSGKLLKGGVDGAGRRITYTNVKLTRSGGTLGTGLNDPANGATGVAKDITSGSVIFNTGDSVGVPRTATTATVGYLYALRITWSDDTTLLSGAYSDTITLLLENDSA